jgi:hypothetical protein
MLALAGARILCGLHYLCLARLVEFMRACLRVTASAKAGGQKTFLLNLYRLIDTQGRGVHGPDERGLERLFTHNVKLYNCVMACAEQSESSIRSLKRPDQRSKGMCAMARWDG